MPLQDTCNGTSIVGLGENDPRNDDAFDSCFQTHKARSLGIVGKPDVIAAIFRIEKSGHKNLGDWNGFGKREIVFGHDAIPSRATATLGERKSCGPVSLANEFVAATQQIESSRYAFEGAAI